MKNLLILFLCLALNSCDDGNLQIETLNFDDTTLQYCGSTAATSSTLFFKIVDSEALMLTLASGTLKNEASEGEVEYPISANTTLTYRIFSANVTKNYFCDVVPVKEPLVIEEIGAQSGFVLITTIQKVVEEVISYEHTIRLSEISLVNKNSDQRITDLTINNFGTVTTK